MSMSEKKKHILLAEDDEFIRRAYQVGLEKSGYEVSVTENGKTAMDFIRFNLPDLLLLDLMMPVKDGFSVLKEMNEEGFLEKIPVVVVSNLGQDSDIKSAIELGATDFLIKSNYSMKDVVAKVKEIF